MFFIITSPKVYYSSFYLITHAIRVQTTRNSELNKKYASEISIQNRKNYVIGKIK